MEMKSAKKLKSPKLKGAKKLATPKLKSAKSSLAAKDLALSMKKYGKGKMKSAASSEMKGKLKSAATGAIKVTSDQDMVDKSEAKLDAEFEKQNAENIKYFNKYKKKK